MGTPVYRGFQNSGNRLELKRRPDIFISHSSADKEFVEKLSHALTKVGVDVWLDEWEMEVGDSLHRSLGVALEESRFVGLVISPRFLSSDWCMEELSQALSRERRQGAKVILPLMYEKVTAPAFIEDRLYVDFSTEFFKGVAELSRIVHGLNKASFMRAVAKRDLGNIAEVWEALEECGWDLESVFDPDDIKALKQRLDELRIPYEFEENGSIALTDDVIIKYGKKLEGLHVYQIMSEFLAHRERVKKGKRGRRLK
jgi:hypothetical protein